jgi:beta-lactam-binding protein with PASTA domain
VSRTPATGRIFISYSSADRERAKQFAEALESQGCSVWWDRHIAAGQTFDEVIEEALTTATCVVVLWSSTSVKSDWVKTEASEAASRGMLVPALIDKVKIPLEFRRVQAADLTRWDGRVDDPEFQLFLRAVRAEVQQNLERLSGAAGPSDPATLISSRRNPTPAPAPPPAAPAVPRVESPVAPTGADHRPRWMTWMLAAVPIVALLAGLLWFYGDRGIETPNVVGLQLPDATAALDALHLVAERREQATDSVSPGTIVAQDPAAGTSLAEGTRVGLTVAVPKAPEVANANRTADVVHADASVVEPAAPAVAMVTIPDLRGQTAERAAELLAEAGLTLGGRKDVANNDVGLGTIVGQAPDSTQAVAKGSTVDLIVAVRRTVPQLTGLTLEAAQQTLLQLGLTERVERVRAAAGERDDQVVKQQPAAGADIEPGTPAVLTIAIVSPKRLFGGERLHQTNGQRCIQVCKEAGLKWNRSWSGATNSCTCEF